MESTFLNVRDGEGSFRRTPNPRVSEITWQMASRFNGPMTHTKWCQLGFVDPHRLCDNYRVDDLCRLSPSQIVMYVAGACTDCRRAISFFEEHHITFLQVSIERDERAMRFVSEVNHGFHSVPTIVFPDGSLLVQPTWEELRAKINWAAH
jgi:mycoredoxin